MANPDVVILGAGAAGLFCAIEAGRRGRQVVVLERGRDPGAKIRISGGGRCNFTNRYCGPENFLSENPHFCRSALARFTPQDFIDRIDAAGIQWHEKKLGQLFCTAPGGAALVVNMLVDACRDTDHVEIRTNRSVRAVRQSGEGFEVVLEDEILRPQTVVVATGGPSIPKMGASGFGYEVAAGFGLPVVSPRAALVPLTLPGKLLHETSKLSGISLTVSAATASNRFEEAMLFTHRGLSGPAILQISSYWNDGESIHVDLLPDADLATIFADARKHSPKRQLGKLLESHLPARLAQWLANGIAASTNLANVSAGTTEELAERIHNWSCVPAGTEGFRTAEVTRGGVSTNALSSKTMETREIPGLFFIGEVVDVTGHLGGFNFQWAWSSGHAAGQVA